MYDFRYRDICFTSPSPTSPRSFGAPILDGYRYIRCIHPIDVALDPFLQAKPSFWPILFILISISRFRSVWHFWLADGWIWHRERSKLGKCNVNWGSTYKIHENRSRHQERAAHWNLAIGFGLEQQHWVSDIKDWYELWEVHHNVKCDNT